MNAFDIAALIITTSFYAAYIGKQLLLRRSGINTNRLAKGDKPISVRRLETALATITFLTPVIQYTSILSHNALLPIISPTPPPLQVAGAVVGVVGVIYFICAITAMRDSWRAGIDASQTTTLVIRGIYGLSRNPAFVGFDLFYIGITLMFPNVLTIVFTATAITLLHIQILKEEQYLSTVFGNDYDEYKRKTLRY